MVDSLMAKAGSFFGVVTSIKIKERFERQLHNWAPTDFCRIS